MCFLFIQPSEIIDDMVFHPPNYMSYMSGADSDTEGESTTSSPVLARKHLEDEERYALVLFVFLFEISDHKYIN